MIWRAILFDRKLTETELITAAAIVFQVPEESVAASHIEEMPEANKKVLCEYYEYNNQIDFKICVEFCLADDLAPIDDFKMLTQLAEILDCRLMTDGYSPAPDVNFIIECVHISDDDIDPE